MQQHVAWKFNKHQKWFRKLTCEIASAHFSLLKRLFSLPIHSHCTCCRKVLLEPYPSCECPRYQWVVRFCSRGKKLSFSVQKCNSVKRKQCLFLGSPPGNTIQETSLYLEETRSQTRETFSLQVSVYHLAKQNFPFQILSFCIMHFYQFKLLDCCPALQIWMCLECQHIQTSTSAIKFEFMLLKTRLHNLNLYSPSILNLVHNLPCISESKM